MFEFPSPQELAELQSFQGFYAVTIYINAAQTSDTADARRIKLKDLLRRAESILREAKVSKRTINKTLRPGFDLLKNGELWFGGQSNLALFLHPYIFRTYQYVNQNTSSTVKVGRGFELQPLLDAMRDNQSYFVLALGHKHVHLYEGDHYHLRRVQLKDFATDIQSALHIDEYPNWLGSHRIAPALAGKGSETFHGQYDKSRVDKLLLTEFFRYIDHRLHFYLSSKQKPLILAGVNYLLPIYRKVNTYRNLWPHSIRGNLNHEQIQAIREKAWSLINAESQGV